MAEPASEEHSLEESGSEGTGCPGGRGAPRVRGESASLRFGGECVSCLGTRFLKVPRLALPSPSAGPVLAHVASSVWSSPPGPLLFCSSLQTEPQLHLPTAALWSSRGSQTSRLRNATATCPSLVHTLHLTGAPETIEPSSFP